MCFKVDDKEPVSAELVAPDDADVKTIWWLGMKKGVRDFVESSKASAVSTTLA